MRYVSRRLGLRLFMVGVTAGAVTLSGLALAAESKPADSSTVRLIVGLKSDGAGATTLRALGATPGVDVLAQEALHALDARTVEVPASDQAAAIAALRSDPNVQYVEVDGQARKFDVTPDDPYYPDQPQLPHIGVPVAWDTTTGSSGVTVAVVDTGVSPVGDLAGAVLAGRDFVNGDNNADDDEGHGSSVASLIAARGNDGEGMAGVCWSCKILPVKVLDGEGFGSNSDVAAGITYAADKGAKIINLSLGSTTSNTVVKNAVAYAVKKGALVIAAAGNDGVAQKNYPAALPDVLAVGGTDENDERFFIDGLGGSNYGRDWVDVAAPFCTFAMTSFGGYDDFCGTSASTPLVSGVAALVRSAQPKANAWSVGAAITSTARTLAGNWLRYGLVDAGAAVAAPLDNVKPKVTGATPKQWARVKGTVTIGATGVSDSGSGISHASLYVDGKYIGRDTTAPYSVKYNTGKRNGTVKVQWRVYDKAGNGAVYDRSITADNTKPKVKITKGPKNNAKVKGTVKLAVSASDKYGVNRVELLINGKVVAKDTKAKYSFSIKVSKYGKKLKVQVRAYDNAGNVTYDKTRNWKR